ncbi:MAG: Lrp/AsnC ligand binding domain-containing protein [Candidatus Hadarchaeales archaeon]
MTKEKMTEAYILITAAIGKVKKVAKALTKIEGVKSVHVVTGPYDIIAFVEAKDMNTLSSVIIEKIHKIAGIVDTNTAVVVDI